MKHKIEFSLKADEFANLPPVHGNDIDMSMDFGSELDKVISGGGGGKRVESSNTTPVVETPKKTWPKKETEVKKEEPISFEEPAVEAPKGSKEYNFAEMRKANEGLRKEREEQAAKLKELAAELKLTDDKADIASIKAEIARIKKEREDFSKTKESLEDELGKHNVTRSREWQEKIVKPTQEIGEKLELLIGEEPTKVILDNLNGLDPSKSEDREKLRTLIKQTAEMHNVRAGDLVDIAKQYVALTSEARNIVDNWKETKANWEIEAKVREEQEFESKVKNTQAVRRSNIRSVIDELGETPIADLAEYEDLEKIGESFDQEMDRVSRSKAALDMKAWTKKALLGEWLEKNADILKELKRKANEYDRIENGMPFKGGGLGKSSGGSSENLADAFKAFNV